MKILFCINSLVKGGAERVISNLANYFIGDNQVAIMTLTNEEIKYELDKKINIIKLDKHKTIKNGLIRKITFLPKNIRRIFLMRKKIDEVNPDIIISFLPQTSFLVLYNKKFNNKKVIVSVRNDPKIEYKSYIYKILMKKLYPAADGFVFQTSEAKEYFNNILTCESEIIPNPVNPIFFCKPYDGHRKKNIVSVGRLEEQKNFELLIDAFSLISKKYNEYKLIIFGEGSKRKSLEKKIENLNLTSKVFLPGVENNIKEKIYDSAMFVMTSDFEGMPNALMEAMALGIPVISTDCPCGGPRELIVNEYNGILIEKGNLEDTQKGMEKIITDEKFAEKIGENAYETSKKLNPDLINQRWKEFILKVSK